MHYTLAPYVGSGRETDAFRPRGHDQPFWRAIDLRPDATRPEGYALVVTPERVRERGVISLGPSPDDRWSMRGLASRLGVTLPRGSLRHAATDLLLGQARTDGTRWHPIWPERDGVYRIWLGGLLAALPTLRGGASFTATWPTAGTVASLTDDQPWTEIAGADWGRTGGRARLASTVGLNIARCDTALATADHGVTLALSTWTYVSGTLAAGPLIRKANDATQTFYYHIAFRDAAANEHRLVKRVAGTATALGSPDATDPAGGSTLTVEASGSSITAKRGGGITVGPITDTAITTGPHVGLFGFATAGQVEVDDFTATDLGATMPAAVGTYALAGQAAALQAARLLPADAGAFAMTGPATALLAQRALAAAVAEYALTGSDGALLQARRLAAEVAPYLLTGVDAGFLATRALPAEVAAFALTGAAADLMRGIVPLAAEAGAFTLNGLPVDLATTGGPAPPLVTRRQTFRAPGATRVFTARPR